MRLVRTCAQPSNIALSRQFRQNQVFKTMDDLLRPVLIETPILKHVSNIQQFPRSYAASALSESLQTKNQRRRISKDERKSMVKEFVNRYREMNAGKFPSASAAIKDVGGSFYVVRGILQELVYESKMRPIDKKEASSEKINIKKDEISNDTEDISRSEYLGEGELVSPISKVSDQKPQPLILIHNDESEDVGIQLPNPINQPTSGFQLDPENGKTIHEDEHKLDGSQSETEIQESEEVSERELHKVPTDDAEHKIQTSMWQNLKSFANSIFEVWKRS